ncbi:MAG: S9 family peptidase [archaeon]
MADRRRLPVPEDLKQIRFVSDAQVSPDGKSVLFVATKVVEEGKNGDYSSNIWRLRGGKIRQLTFREGRNTNPRWSPNGRSVLFLSSRRREQESYTRLMVMPSDGGEANTILELKKGKLEGKIVDPRWTPDGSGIVFLSDMKRRSDQDSDVKVVRRIVYRLNEAGYFHDKRTHLYSISRNGGKPKQLTSGEFDIQAFSVSPDASKVAFVANMTEEADYTLVRDVHTMPIGGGSITTVTQSKGPIHSVDWSPDSKMLTYAGHDLSRRLATLVSVWTVPSAGGTSVNLTRKHDIGIGNSLGSDSKVATPDPGPVWSSDGTSIYFLATDKGSCNLFRISSTGGPIEPVTKGNRCVEGFRFSRNGNILAYTSMDALSPAELFIRDRDLEWKATRFNDTLMSDLRLSNPEIFTFKASDGQMIEGWIMKPQNYEGGKAPAIVEIHGGPRTAYGNTMMLEFQLLAANGYVVIFTNPRGSSAYGEDFAAAIPRDYGNRDYKDIMEAVDHVLHLGFIDENRIGVTGGSYGGFMTNWIVGHTNRFKAAVTQRSISNWISFYGTSDIGYYFADEEVGAEPWNNTEHFWEVSPLKYAENIKTPLLIIHSEEDYRCPIEQGEQLFVALKRLKRETMLVRFPGESHELSRSGKPRHRIESLTHIIDWFNKHL